MKQNASMILDSRSVWKVNTPNTISKRLPFYIHEYGHYIAKNGYFTEREGLENYLLFYTLSGKGYLKYMDHEHVLNPGEAVVIYCANYQYYKTLSKEPWEFKWVHFSGTAVPNYYELLSGESLKPVPIKIQSAFEKSLDDLCLYIPTSNITSNIRTSELLTHILTEMVISRFSPSSGRSFHAHSQDIEKVLQYIECNYNKKTTLDDLVTVACMSKYHFLRVFKNHIGMSPYEYLLHFRINKAKELLKGTRVPVAEVASLTGFGDPNNFIRKFKEIAGCTPLQYRRYTL